MTSYCQAVSLGRLIKLIWVVLAMHSNDDNSSYEHGKSASTLNANSSYTESRTDLKRHASYTNGNGVTHGDESKQMVDEEVYPRKSRKLDNADVKPHRPPSPPWKPVTVDGPTSFVLDGRRKSSRTNLLPIDLRPSGDKRLTRSAAYPSKSRSSLPSPKRLTNGYHQESNDSPKTPPKTRRRGVGERRTSLASPSSVTKSKVTIDSSPAKSPHTYSLRKSSLSPAQRRHDTSFLLKRPYRRRSERYDEADQSNKKDVGLSPDLDTKSQYQIASGRLQRIRLKVRPPSAPTFHPQHYAYASQYSSLREWAENDEALAGEEDANLTREEAENEARVRQRLLDESQSGGLLSRERCSVYQLERQEEPSSQYGHVDHLIAHAANFRTLMSRERRSHEATAKKIAYEARERWRVLQEIRKKKEAEERRRLRASQPKSQEEIWEEERDHAKIRHDQIVKDLTQMWALVRSEVKKIRYMRWEDQQQALGKKALNEMLDKSTRLLDSRRNRHSVDSDISIENHDIENFTDESETESEMDEFGNAIDDDGEEKSDANESADSDNMSSSEKSSDESLSGDNKLSVEELRKRYPGIGLKTPASAQVIASRGASEANDDEASDRSLSIDLIQNSDESDTEQQKSPKAQLSGPSPVSKVEHTNGTYKSNTTGVLDEVDPLLMDEFGSATDDMDSETSSEEIDTSSSVESEDEEGVATSMLGFLGKNELDKVVSHAEPKSETCERGAPHSRDNVSETTYQSRRENEAANTVQLSSLHDDKTIYAAKDTSVQVDMQSADPSSYSSLRTSSTPKPAAPESVSSVEVQDSEQKSLKADDAKASQNILTKVPSLLRGDLREYQHYGLDWLAYLYANNTNGILADEMGLGKTIQTIALLAHLAVDKAVWGPHLVVVPTSVILNWEMEFKKWCPGFKILTYYGTIEERKRKRQGWLDNDRWNVCITSYQLVLQDEMAFKRRTWHYLILDEAHSIKNFQTQRWQKLLGFKTHARLLLTGTPLQNNLTELWSLMFFLMPRGFDQESGFAGLEEWLNATRRPADQILEQGREQLDPQAQKTVSKLHDVLRPYLLRRLKADVEKQMPAKHEHVVYCRLSKRQRQLYDGFMARADTKRTLASGNYMSIINCLMSLRKVCNHPDLFETRQIVTSFATPKSVVADYEIKNLLMKKRLMDEDNSKKLDLDFLNLKLYAHEDMSATYAIRCQDLSASKQLEDLIERETHLLKPRSQFDGTSIGAIYTYMAAEAERSKVDALRRSAYATKHKTARRPLYGSGLTSKLNLNLADRLFCEAPPRRALTSEWYLKRSELLRNAVQTLNERSLAMNTIIRKFSCITPAVVTNDMATLALGPHTSSEIQHLGQQQGYDPYHEARMCLSIAFPDKRLLQFDCGKLQRLDKLLRELQAGGHRALIFTQMTKVLDILEQFLNIHGHRYLRLDGATKIEQRQMLTDQFNSDPRILVFILSSRSGGLGINLTGADTVIFYDLDWNPAMDKQCQDRCHRIGQTRDVHIYRFVSEHTIEANILRKSNQKRLLDDVIIQKGDFTTDYFNRLTYKDALDDVNDENVTKSREDTEAGAAMEKVLGDVGGGLGKVLESVEDKEDTVAANVAQKEMVNLVDNDDADFADAGDNKSSSGGPSATPKTSVPPTPRDGAGAGAGTTSVTSVEPNGLSVNNTNPTKEPTEREVRSHVDEYMLRFVDEVELADVPLEPPPDKRKKAKKGHDQRVRLGGR